MYRFWCSICWNNFIYLISMIRFFASGTISSLVAIKRISKNFQTLQIWLKFCAISKQKIVIEHFNSFIDWCLNIMQTKSIWPKLKAWWQFLHLSLQQQCIITLWRGGGRSNYYMNMGGRWGWKRAKKVLHNL